MIKYDKMLYEVLINYIPKISNSLSEISEELNEYELNGYRSIWDASGNDTIDAFDSSSSVVIDLRNATLENEIGGGGFLSKINDEYKGYTIAYDSLTLAGFGDGAYQAVIENARGSFMNDSLQGNDYDNLLEGEGGDDTLIGAAGADTLYGAEGDDVYTGGAGGDLFVFDSGANIINDFDPSPSGDNDDIAIDFGVVDPRVGRGFPLPLLPEVDPEGELEGLDLSEVLPEPLDPVPQESGLVVPLNGGLRGHGMPPRGNR